MGVRCIPLSRVNGGVQRLSWSKRSRCTKLRPENPRGDVSCLYSEAEVSRDAAESCLELKIDNYFIEN